MTNNPLILVDGSSFLYRAYHVSRQNFTNSKGIPTGVSLIITKMMQSLLNKFAGSKFIVVFDAKISCVILNLFSNYLLLVYKNAFYFYIFNMYSYSGTLQNLSNKFSILLINSTWCLKYTIMISVITP